MKLGKSCFEALSLVQVLKIWKSNHLLTHMLFQTDMADFLNMKKIFWIIFQLFCQYSESAGPKPTFESYDFVKTLTNNLFLLYRRK